MFLVLLCSFFHLPLLQVLLVGSAPLCNAPAFDHHSRGSEGLGSHCAGKCRDKMIDDSKHMHVVLTAVPSEL